MAEPLISGALLFDHIAFTRARDELDGVSHTRTLVIHAQTIKDKLTLLAALKRAVWYLKIDEPHNTEIVRDLENVIAKAESTPHAETSANPTL